MSCSNKNIYKNDIIELPKFTNELLKIGRNCGCVLSDTEMITCLCKNPNWEKDIRIVCNHPPVDENDLMNNCYQFFV